MYPDLAPGRWYPVATRNTDDARPKGPSSSGGGPTPSAGLWITVDGTDRFLFRHHVMTRTTSGRDADDLH